MGAVAINRKRTEDSLNFNQQSPSQSSNKKRRFSFGITSPDSNKPSSSSRISRYPDAKAPLRREIHAPSRASLRYGPPKPRPIDHYKKRAFDALRFFTKEKEVIDLGDEELEVVVDCDLEEEEEEKDVVEPPPPPSSSMLDSMSLVSQEKATTDAASSLAAYKKLLESAERRNPKLEALGFEILFNEKKLSQLRLSRPKPLEKPLKVICYSPHS